MHVRIIIFSLILFQSDLFGQADSIWNVMVLKKGNLPEMKDDMAVFNHTGFNLYRNCFYDFLLKDQTKKTLRLIDIKPDSLFFTGISEKRDADFSQTSKDTFAIHYNNIDKLLLIKDWGAKNSRKIKLDDYYFVFYKSVDKNVYDSKYASVFSSADSKSELVPRLSSTGIAYQFEYGGRLYHYSGFQVQTIKYTDEQKVKTLNGILTALDLIVNKRLMITVEKKQANEN